MSIKNFSFILVALICFIQTIKAASSFVPNHGQINPKFTFNNLPVRYYSEDHNLRVFINDQGIIYQFVRNNSEGKKEKIRVHSGNPTYDAFTFEMKLMNCNQTSNWQSSDSMDTRLNFYNENCGKGVENIHPCKQILLKNIYNNIDWEIIFDNGEIKYNFIVHPGGNPSDIEMHYSYADKIQLLNHNLHIQTSLGQVYENQPVIFQNQKSFSANFVLTENTVKFQLPEYYSSSELIIDPGVRWSTYFGGANDDYAQNVVTDLDQNVILSGETYSLDGIFFGGFQSTLNGNSDIFIAKYSNDGQLLWSTYYGGEDLEDLANTITDSLNYIYSAISTSSFTGIAYNGYQDTMLNGSDYALIKLNPQGQRIWSEYFDMGAPGNGSNTGILLDHENKLLLYGNAPDFWGGPDYHFMSMFDTSGYHLNDTLFYNFLVINNIVSDSLGNLILCASTDISGLANNGFRDSIIGAYDLYISKFHPGSSNSIWATYYGGSRDEAGKCIIDKNNSVYLYGITTSLDNIAFHGYQSTYESLNFTWDGFVVKFDSSGQREWGSYFGGKENDAIHSATTDSQDHLIIAGETYSDSGMTKLAYKNTIQGNDAFVSEFNPDGSLVWSTYFGGTNGDWATSCTVDTFDNIYICGPTGSTDQISINAFDSSFGGSGDAFLAQLNCDGWSQSAVVYGENSPDNFSDYIYTLDTSGALGFEWEIEGGHIISGQYTDSVTVHWDSLGTGAITGYVMYSQGCFSGNTFTTLVNDLPKITDSHALIYPNPATSEFYISGKQISEIKILDVTGRDVYFSKSENPFYSTTGFSPGVYFVSFLENGKCVKGKLVISK
ncbi:MAG: T9SS type A sorting domain-containing protein [Bacteroidia bacterium]